MLHLMKAVQSLGYKLWCEAAHLSQLVVVPLHPCHPWSHCALDWGLEAGFVSFIVLVSHALLRHRDWARGGKEASLCRILSCGCCSQKYALSSWAGFIPIYLQLLSLLSSTLKAQLNACGNAIISCALWGQEQLEDLSSGTGGFV